MLFRRAATRTRKDPTTETSKDAFWTLQDAQRIAIREKLLQALGSENTTNVKNKVSDAVAEIARQYADEGGV